jgi:hypothetical protein
MIHLFLLLEITIIFIIIINFIIIIIIIIQLGNIKNKTIIKHLKKSYWLLHVPLKQFEFVLK